MSLNSRDRATGVRGSHWKNPLLVSGGPLDDSPRGPADLAHSAYQIHYESFNESFVDGGFVGAGWTLTDINSATTPTEVVDPETGYLLLNPGTKDDSGSAVQKILLPSQGTFVVPSHDVLGPITATATLMDGREIFFQTRVGVMSATTAWDAKALIGWYITDTTLLATAGGLPTVGAGGGFGFHIGEDGIISTHCTDAAITTAGTASTKDVSTVVANTVTWFTLGARMRVIDASAGTGFCDFFIDGNHVNRIGDTMCMDTNAEEFSYTMSIVNGDNTNDHDLVVDYILTGITRPGLTWPYDDGTIY